MKIDYKIEKLYSNGRTFSIFLSHRNSTDTWKQLAAQLSERGISITSDSEIKPGEIDFAMSIKQMIRNNEIVLLLVEDEDITPWMTYELGIAEGLKKKIILFSYTKVDYNADYLFRKYGPVINDIDDLVNEIKNSFFFSELFEQETYELRKNDFLNFCMSNIEICKLSFMIPGIQDIPKKVYKFGYILMSLTRYEKLEVPDRTTTSCNMNLQEIEDMKCHIDGRPCSLCTKQTYEAPTDVILSKILHNCSVDNSNQTLSFVIPFNRQNGVTFKGFVDVYNMDYVQDIILVLQRAGLKGIGISHSVLGNRIYFLMPHSFHNGLFEVESPDGFLNNYLCKGAIL